jgi:hypothetical protein
MAIKTHEVTKAADGDLFATHTLTVDSFVIDGVDIVEADITAPHMVTLVAAIKAAVLDHTAEA